MHDPSDLKTRTIHKPCKACGAPVPFKVWLGFREIARHLAAMCPACHCVSVLEGPDSWHKNHVSYGRSLTAARTDPNPA